MTQKHIQPHPSCRRSWLRTPPSGLSEDQLDQVSLSHVPLSCYVALRDRSQDQTAYDGLVVPSFETHCSNCEVHAWLLLKNGSGQSSPTKYPNNLSRSELVISTLTGSYFPSIPRRISSVSCRLSLPTLGALKSESCHSKSCKLCFQEQDDFHQKRMEALHGEVFGQKQTPSLKTANTTNSSK